MSDISKYLVLIASMDNTVGFSTHGTGFLISIRDKAYAVTCRHVAMDMYKIKFIIPNPKKTNNITTARLLSEPIYYNMYEPYIDLCLMELPEYPASVLNANGIYTMSLDSFSHVSINMNIGDSISAYGFPGDYISKSLMEDKPNEKLLYSKINGTVINASLIGKGFQAENDYQFLTYDSQSVNIAMTTEVVSLQTGISGGPVVGKTGSLCGIITGGAEDKELTPKMKCNIFIFISASFLINMLSRLP